MKSRMQSVVSTGIVLFVAAAVLPGCNQQLKRNSDALYVQNQELQDKYNLALADLDSERARNATLTTELDLMRAAPVAAAEAAYGAGFESAETGFSDIAGVDVIRGSGTLTVRVPGDILFSSGRTNLKKSAKSTLDQIAGVLQSEYPHNNVRIEGHTDTDPIKKSGWKDNLELSLQRAASVHRYLQTQGIEAERIYAAGFGPTRPQETKAKSRRVEIVVVMQD